MPAGRLAKGTVIHSAGWPLPDSCYGGSWIYAQSDTRLSIGFVTALDGGPPGLDPYEMMQTWKTHPFVRPLLEGGTVIKAGTKTVPEGGWWSRPKSYGDGFLILGDAGSLLNIARLKGIHTALEVRAARRRDGRRTRSCAAICRRPRSPPTRTASRPPGSATSSGASATGARRSRRASPAGRSTRACSGSSAARSSRTGCRSTRTSPRCEHGQASAGPHLQAGRQAHVRQGHGRLPGRIDARGAPAVAPEGRRHRTSAPPGAPPSTATRASASAPPRSTRWSQPSAAASACRSTSRTACTARRATSSTPTRSSRGRSRRIRADRATRACSRGCAAAPGSGRTSRVRRRPSRGSPPIAAEHRCSG